MPLVCTVDEIVISAGGFAAEQDPYGQGAAWVSADVTVKDAETVVALQEASEQRNVVTIKCVNLEVDGTVGRSKRTNRGIQFSVMVQDVRFIKPKQPWE